MCLKCVGGELEALRQRYDELRCEEHRNWKAYSEQLNTLLRSYWKIVKQRDAAVKAARRWKAAANSSKATHEMWTYSFCKLLADAHGLSLDEREIMLVARDVDGKLKV